MIHKGIQKINEDIVSLCDYESRILNEDTITTDGSKTHNSMVISDILRSFNIGIFFKKLRFFP